MPGVPSGRGCEACRKQKKKCDQQQPICSRCSRLQIECVGSGVRRFKFTEPAQFTNGSKHGEQISKIQTNQRSYSPLDFVSRAPSNDASVHLKAFVETIRPTTDRRYNLLFTYGSFLHYVPNRLGTNEALDASVAALTAAHATICTQSGVTPNALAAYSNALTKLRESLDVPEKACSTETLCAAMILSICQSFLGGGTQSGLSHTAGMARILKHRGRFHNPNDDFESALLLTLRGPVVFEALWNEAIEFTDAEWEELVTNHLDRDNQPHAPRKGHLMSCISRVPGFLRRRRQWSANEIQEAMFVYHTMQLERVEMHKHLTKVQQLVLDGRKDPLIMQAHFDLVRVYAITLAVVVVLARVLSAVSRFYGGLREEMHKCAVELLSLSQPMARYRPFGASIMPLALAMAWIGTEDMKLRVAMANSFREFSRDFPRDVPKDDKDLVLGLESFARQFKLLEISNIS